MSAIFASQCRRVLEDKELLERLKAEKFDLAITEPFDTCAYGNKLKIALQNHNFQFKNSSTLSKSVLTWLFSLAAVLIMFPLQSDNQLHQVMYREPNQLMGRRWQLVRSSWIFCTLWWEISCSGILEMRITRWRRKSFQEFGHGE